MDDRQRQIREGAGLAESRLNEEFIEFLQKWSMPLLVAIAVMAVGYTIYGKVQKAHDEKVDQAFQEYETAAGAANPSPDSLRRIAEEYDGVRAVPLLARLAAADAYMKTVRAGVKPGAQFKPDGTLANPDDALSDQDRQTNLTRARDLYQQVLEESSRSESDRIIRVSALYGLAAVAESRKEFEGAKAHYEKIIAICENTGLALQAKLARERIDSLPSLAQDVKLYHMADLAKLPDLTPSAAPGANGAPPGAAPPTPAPAAAPTAEPATEAPKAPDAKPGEPAPVPAPSPAPAEPPKSPDPTPPAPTPGTPK